MNPSKREDSGTRILPTKSTGFYDILKGDVLVGHIDYVFSLWRWDLLMFTPPFVIKFAHYDEAERYAKTMM